MEQPLACDKNAVYASLPLLWSSLQEQLGNTIRADEQSPTLQQLAYAAVDKNGVDVEQFQATVHRQENTISITATLDATILFEPYFEHMASGTTFSGIPVEAFGMSENSFDHLHKQIEIHRYRDDNHFIIGLLPTDRQQQVLIYKTDKKYTTLAAMYTGLQDEIQHGRADMTVPDRLWRYSWTPYDRVAIPRIVLGVQGAYPQLSGSILQNGEEQLTLASVHQSVAFLLNETGTKLAAEMNKEVDRNGLPRAAFTPKTMMLDKPFYIIVKKKDDNLSPYLVLWINNTELLEIK
ncbi:hypothetical protein [Sphingobacterium sp. SGR-19]|uniref:hypothetical protein n=1 Tax=Sphingobacterium sp. SGR-19 TaxID=2710886 RepID=UPI0013E9A3EB|nr:hypothetical protein [Sphingobacterium sp. SGR-19]NGM64706.1 hypothetical protein [Sphingobacterium sp. SGR-19]